MAEVDLSGYVTVPERIEAFRAAYPDGRLTRVGPNGVLEPLEFVQYAGADWVIYTAFCYRSPDDEHPGVGTAWERIPGTTPYTRASEVQNAETSAWGRAIVARLNATTVRGIATREEVELARSRQEPLPPRDWVAEANDCATAEQVRKLWREAKAKRAPQDVLDRLARIGEAFAEMEGPTAGTLQRKGAGDD